MEADYGIDIMAQGLQWFSDSGATSAMTTTTVNTEVYAKLNFKTPDVRAVYVDWDDGESNKIDEANYQWYTTTEPTKSVVIPHTYNKTGNTFNPVVQTINSNGIVSQYYGNEATNTDITPYNQMTAVSGVRVDDERPTAIMRTENIEVNAGIDNSIFEVQGTKNVAIAIAPTLTRAELTGTIKQITLEVEAVFNFNKLYKQGTVDDTRLGNEFKQRKILFDIDLTSKDNGIYDFTFDTGGAFEDDNGGVAKVISFRYVSCKATGTTAANAGTDYTTNEIFNRLKIFLVAKSDGGRYYPISYVTAGSPVKHVKDNKRFVTLDMSQSRAAGSNVAISDYRYDNGKGWFSPVNQWSLSTDILASGTSTGTNPLVQVSYGYSLNPRGVNQRGAAHRVFGSGSSPAFTWYTTGTTSGAIREDSVPIDDYGRFYDQYFDTRTSVVAASNSGSLITANQPMAMQIVPALNWGGPNVTKVTGQDDSSNVANNSGDATGIVAGTSMALQNYGNQAIRDVTGSPVDQTNENQYILLGFDSKTNKVFFNTTTWANDIVSSIDSITELAGLKISGLSYLKVTNKGNRKQNVSWEPLKYEDTTRIMREQRETSEEVYNDFYTSFGKSGYLKYDMPSDWGAMSITDLCGGVFNTASGSFSACTAAGFDDITVTGTSTQIAGGISSSGYGDGLVKVVLSTAGDKTLVETLGSAEDIGAYKYAFITKGNNTASGSMFWIASGASDGWNASAGTHGTLYLQVGTTGTSAENPNYDIPASATAITGSIRRINIYDVLVGAEKVFSDDGPGAIATRKLIPVGGDTYNAGTSFFKNLYCAQQAFLTGSDWSTSDKYLLRLAISGTTNAGTSDNQPCPQIWNIFDGNQGDSSIVKVVDDSAYNLNSLNITSDLSVGRAGQYYKAITRKGKVFIAKTGHSITEIGFTSVALGDENSSGAFDDHGPSTLYGHLHKIRNIQADAVRVYWDEPQKDGTFIRFWGMITNVNETRGTGGPRAVMSYTFTLVVEDIALISNVGKLMTDIFPLGGVNEQYYS